MNYLQGHKFKKHNEEYILAQVEPYKFTLISLSDGNRYIDPTSIYGVYECINKYNFEFIKNEDTHSQIRETALNIAELVERKNKDYGNSFARTMDEYGSTAYFLRIEDKLNRLKTLFKADCKAEVEESVEDTLKDIIGYTLLMINYYR